MKRIRTRPISELDAKYFTPEDIAELEKAVQADLRKMRVRPSRATPKAGAKKPPRAPNPHVSTETLGDLIAERSTRDPTFGVALAAARAHRPARRAKPTGRRPPR